jgi:hypothetical protein
MTTGGHNKPSPRRIQCYDPFFAFPRTRHNACAFRAGGSALRIYSTGQAGKALAFYMSDIVRDAPSVVCSKLLILQKLINSLD